MSLNAHRFGVVAALLAGAAAVVISTPLTARFAADSAEPERLAFFHGHPGAISIGDAFADTHFWAWICEAAALSVVSLLLTLAVGGAVAYALAREGTLFMRWLRVWITTEEQPGS